MRLKSSPESMDLRMESLVLLSSLERFSASASRSLMSLMHLGEAHAADDERREGDAAEEIHAAEIIPGRAGEGIDADGGHQDAQHGA